MDEKISLKAVDLYAQEYASRLANSFFSKQGKISGNEILQLSAIKQVNLFIIRDLLFAWKQESDKFKSPYFNYESSDVKEALAAFQNTLSNHILIAREHFLPLLTRAVSQSIYLILDPYDFYSDTLDKNKGGIVKTAELKNEVKYIKINKAPLEKLVTKLEERNMTTVSGNEAFAMLDQILEEVNFAPEEVDPYLQLFNQVAPLKAENFYEARPQSAAPVVSKPETSSPLSAMQTTVTASAQKEAIQTLADDLAKKKIVSLKQNLTINQKFMFTKILFHGDFEIFSDAIDKLDRYDNLGQAMRYIADSYPHWDKESEEYLEFIEIIEKRFSN